MFANGLKGNVSTTGEGMVLFHLLSRRIVWSDLFGINGTERVNGRVLNGCGLFASERGKGNRSSKGVK